MARSSGTVCLRSGFCTSARVFAPRFLPIPPHGDTLRFAITSRPSRCEEDLHLLADEHARHTIKRPTQCEWAKIPGALELDGGPSQMSAVGKSPRVRIERAVH